MICNACLGSTVGVRSHGHCTHELRFGSHRLTTPLVSPPLAHSRPPPTRRWLYPLAVSVGCIRWLYPLVVSIGCLRWLSPLAVSHTRRVAVCLLSASFGYKPGRSRRQATRANTSSPSLWVMCRVKSYQGGSNTIRTCEEVCCVFVYCVLRIVDVVPRLMCRVVVYSVLVGSHCKPDRYMSYA